MILYDMEVGYWILGVLGGQCWMAIPVEWRRVAGAMVGVCCGSDILPRGIFTRGKSHTI